MSLPDFEAWAIFVKVVQTGSFSRAAIELGLSKATVSKAVARLELRLGSHLLQRTSRRLAPTEIGRQSMARAQRMLVEAEAADLEASEQAAAPRGKVRMTAPVFFGIEYVAPLLPALFLAYPDVSIDLHLSDAVVDLVGEGFDLAVRVAALADSTLRAKRLCAVRALVVGAPAYFEQYGTPAHPQDLNAHRCLTYALGNDPGRWRFENAAGDEAIVTPHGPLRSNSGEAFLPLLRASCGVTVLPEFMVWRDLAAGTLRPVLTDWSVGSLGLNLVMPPGGLRAARVQVVIDALTRHLSGAAWAAKVPPECVDAQHEPKRAPSPAPRV
jgi:DNA-binding transcriptional LysR family regulator